MPVMSTLGTRALLDFIDSGDLYLCEQFVCYNPLDSRPPRSGSTLNGSG